MSSSDRRVPRRESTYLSADERREKGKALRDKAPRVAQAGWKPLKARPDPIEIVSQSNAGRLPQLVPIRFGRMSTSPFAFYRGSAALMAADLAKTATGGIRVQACGDAAMMAGCMGSGRTFDDAIGEFAVEYADQNRRDFRQGRIETLVEA